MNYINTITQTVCIVLCFVFATSCRSESHSIVIDNRSIGYRVVYIINGEPLGCGRWPSSALIPPEYLWKRENQMRFVATFDSVDAIKGSGEVNVRLIKMDGARTEIDRKVTERQQLPVVEWTWEIAGEGESIDPLKGFDPVNNITEEERKRIRNVVNGFQLIAQAAPSKLVSELEKVGLGGTFPLEILQRIVNARLEGNNVNHECPVITQTNSIGYSSH